MSGLTTEDTEDTEKILLGLLANCLNDNDAKMVIDQIELYLRRNNAAIGICNNRLAFAFLQKTGGEK